MMIVLVVTNCPPKLRGDLTKWLIEINTGTYVGDLSARVRDEVWTRVCETIKTGRASLVFHAQNEQKLDFRVHNTSWEPIDYDGIKLVRRPILGSTDLTQTNGGFSKASKIQKIEKNQSNRIRGNEYIVIDVETTGVSCEENQIIEIAALHVNNGKILKEFQVLVKYGFTLPENIVALTGITDELLCKEGIGLKEAIIKFQEFIGNQLLVGYNISFDLAFLQVSCKKCNLQIIRNRNIDIFNLARRNLDKVKDYKLSSVADYLGLKINDSHRALPDCYTTYKVYEKLKNK